MMLFRPKELGSHVHVRVFVNHEMSGVLVMRTDEWDRMADAIDEVPIFHREPATA